MLKKCERKFEETGTEYNISNEGMIEKGWKNEEEEVRGRRREGEREHMRQNGEHSIHLTQFSLL